MKYQETFDKVVAHLRAQKKQARCLNEEGAEVCCYRADDGSKCAVGCLIPDELYRSSLEGMGIHTLLRQSPELRDILGPSVDIRFLQDLQLLHDQYPPNKWEERFAKMAFDWSLNYTCP